jgi:hypothetical protein
MILRSLLLAALCAVPMVASATAEELHVLAAGSLSEVMDEIGERYKAGTRTSGTVEFGPSGLLRERIEKGDRADLLASADMGHPLKLLQEGRATRVAMFPRNTLAGLRYRGSASRRPIFLIACSTRRSSPAPRRHRSYTNQRCTRIKHGSHAYPKPCRARCFLLPQRCADSVVPRVSIRCFFEGLILVRSLKYLEFLFDLEPRGGGAARNSLYFARRHPR